MLSLSIFWGLSLDYCIPSASLVLPLGWMLIALKENTLTTQNCIELPLPIQNGQTKHTYTNLYFMVPWYPGLYKRGGLKSSQCMLHKQC